jgi:aminoglycoside phosphotransferase family enzyme
MVQTHISIVFIGDDYVYKIKKPVNFGFLDFSTLEKRKYYCEKEVELNNRFSTGVYLGVFPVTFDGTTHCIVGKGDIVDYAVKMKRLSDDDLLKTRFSNRTATTDDMKRIGKAIAEFHKHSTQSKEIDAYGSIETLKFNTDENFDQTAEFIGQTITNTQFQELQTWTNEFYSKNADLIQQRIQDGKIRDCHGDLHMEHICLTDPIIIFDCIEFNDRFRYSDILSDISFLMMDLEFNKGIRLSDALQIAYLKALNESNTDKITSLIKYYKIYRAYVRGKVTSFVLKDAAVSDGKKIHAKHIAQQYFALAHSYMKK